MNQDCVKPHPLWRMSFVSLCELKGDSLPHRVIIVYVSARRETKHFQIPVMLLDVAQAALCRQSFWCLEARRSDGHLIDSPGWVIDDSKRVVRRRNPVFAPVASGPHTISARRVAE